MPRKYGSQKTTTKAGFNEYLREYMRDYRKRERAAIRKARRLLGMDTRVVHRKKRTR